ncbi:MAG: formate/nitrite transporter family protein [Bryocella sp.]
MNEEQETAEKTKNTPQTEGNESSNEPVEAEPEAAPVEAPVEQASQKNLERPSAEEIYKQVAKNDESELKRTSLSLAISGVTGGMFMGLSALGVGIILALLGPSHHSFVLSRMFYPLGFIVVILGRSQLFTENTLYPVALVLAEKKQFWNTMRLWAIVLPSNVAGALIFAALIALTPAVPWPILHAVANLGVDAAHMPPATIFWSAVMAGWIIATTAWLVSGSHSITGSVMLIWVLTFVVGLGGFAHCIASSAEIFTAVLTRAVPWTAYPHWLGIAVSGNVCGGVFMVTLLEYGQSMAGLSLEQETMNDLAPNKLVK